MVSLRQEWLGFLLAARLRNWDANSRPWWQRQCTRANKQELELQVICHSFLLAKKTFSVPATLLQTAEFSTNHFRPREYLSLHGSECHPVFRVTVGGVTAEELQTSRTKLQVLNESGDTLEPLASSTVSAITIQEPPSILTSFFRRSRRNKAPIQIPIPNEAPRFSCIRYQQVIFSTNRADSAKIAPHSAGVGYPSRLIFPSAFDIWRQYWFRSSWYVSSISLEVEASEGASIQYLTRTETAHCCSCLRKQDIRNLFNWMLLQALMLTHIIQISSLLSIPRLLLIGSLFRRLRALSLLALSHKRCEQVQIIAWGALQKFAQTDLLRLFSGWVHMANSPCCLKITKTSTYWKLSFRIQEQLHCSNNRYTYKWWRERRHGRTRKMAFECRASQGKWALTLYTAQVIVSTAHLQRRRTYSRLPASNGSFLRINSI